MSDADQSQKPPPHPAAAAAVPPPSPAAIEEAARVLAALTQDPDLLTTVGEETRKALQQHGGILAKPDLKARKRFQKTLLRKEQAARKGDDERLRRLSQIRKLRDEPVYRPAFPVLPTRGADASGWFPVLHGSVEALHAKERALPAPAAEASGATATVTAGAAAPAEGGELHEARACYVCKREYRRVHRFYDGFCAECGDENERRRTPTADLRGRVALVTGARVKIGYHAALMLLRAGCAVVACTRFPRDAAARYAREPDFEAWRDRLTVHGIDLRHSPSVEHLCHWLDQTLPRLDFQIHNACQTVRRPPGFYAHLVEDEHRPAGELPAALLPLLRSDEALRAEHAAPTAAGLTRSRPPHPGAERGRPPPGRRRPEALEIFPKGVLDAGPAAGRPARHQLLAAGAPRGPDPRAPRGAPRQRHRPLRDGLAPEGAHGPLRHAPRRHRHERRRGPPRRHGERHGGAVLPIAERPTATRTPTWPRRPSTCSSARAPPTCARAASTRTPWTPAG